MMSLLLLIAVQAATPDILVTASRVPADGDEVGVSATVIDERRIDALGKVQAVDLLRLTPGLSVSVSGARGTQAQVRIRGAEANHSLLFIDGIQFNDPAAGNEPRFETLTADGLGRIEVVRGPQSALWGSEAIGGVISLQSPDPLSGPRFTATGEYGERDSIRGAATAVVGGRSAGLTLSAVRLEGDGVDVLGGGTGDRDGFENSSIGLHGVARPGSDAADAEFGFAARYVDAFSEFDGTDPLTFQRADTAEDSATETGAVRLYARLGASRRGPWTLTIDGQYLISENRNRNAGVFVNRTDGERFKVSGQLERRLRLFASDHALIGAVEHEDESFSARDLQFGGATAQDRTRGRTALVGEWRAQWGERLSTDIAVRHDDFNRFVDATTLRATGAFEVGGGFTLTGSYGEGIAQPTFFDLFGFFPGSFVGNPALRPERSRSYEIGFRWEGEQAGVAVALFDSRLKDEVVGTFDPATFIASTANASGVSRRQGVEIAAAATPVAGLRLSANYTYLDAEDQQVTGSARLREVRRPRHSGNVAFDWTIGRLLLGGSLAYVGDRRDTDFDLFPAPTVTLDDYVLGSLRAGYRLTESLEAFGRVENAFDSDYQDLVGYQTPGRSVHAGLRILLGR